MPSAIARKRLRSPPAPSKFARWGRGLTDTRKAPAAGPRRSAPDPGRVRDLPTEANQLAAVARSLRAKMMTARIGGSVTAGEIADIVGQIELLADSVAALLED
jgi:hypothetical protein